MTTIDLKGQLAVVTGGASGIGQAIVTTLSESGATVISGDITYSHELSDQNQAVIESFVDLSNEQDISRWTSLILTKIGVPDIVVNCAGISTMDFVVESRLTDWEKVFAINSTATYLVSRNFAKALTEADKSGRIIQIASQAGKNGYRGMGGYCASKHAVLGLTKVMATELAAKNILVNAVCPGIVETKMKQRERVEGGLLRGMTAEEIYAEDCSQVPLGRTALPQDIANVVLFLASPLASYMTGQAINVTGGMTMH